jgi:hypothetical protein
VQAVSGLPLQARQLCAEASSPRPLRGLWRAQVK